MTQIPRGDESLDCPLHKASCDTVCHRCPWWKKVTGANPQTGQIMDRWECAIAWLPLLLIDAAGAARSGAAATESFRNEMVSLSRPADQRSLPSSPIAVGADRLLAAGK